MQDVYSKRTFIDLWDQSVTKLWDALPELLPKIIYTIILLVIIGFIRSLIIKVALKKIHDSVSRLQWQRTVSYIFTFLMFIILMPVWLPSLQSVTAFLGFFGAGVLIVFKEVLLNLAGWVFIISRRPFVPGNRIQLGDAIGDVLDQRIMAFSMIEVKSREEGGQSTGRIVHVPNSKVFTDLIHNASKDFALNWNEIYLFIDIKSNWQKAADILENIAENIIEKVSPNDKRLRQAEELLAIKYKKLNPSVYVDIIEGKVRLTLRHLTDPMQTRFITDKIWRIILNDISEEKDIVIL
ncbi:MAG: mechanosensitive ion channel family protein [Spirochaetia bacterium]|nr:mechanosensitive ion channel family protein [Spirochaetia bacterium]